MIMQVGGRYGSRNASEISARSTESGGHDSASDSGFHGERKEEIARLHKHECGDLVHDLSVRLATLAHLTTDFANDVRKQTESPRDLLDEMETKMREYIIALDVDLMTAERAVRVNLDKCRISESRVTWLLEFNRSQLDMRKVFAMIATNIYEDLDRVLRIRARGCGHVELKTQTDKQLNDMLSILSNVQRCIELERQRPEEDAV
jgi:hypothetical protein